MRWRKKLAALAVLVATLPLGGSFCEGEPGLDLPTAILAVGASWQVRVSDDCSVWPWCSRARIVEILDVVDQDEGIFAVGDVAADSFTLTALRPGVTAITVVALDQDREVRREKATFEARRATSVQLRTTSCDHEVYSPSAPLPVTPNAELVFTFRLVDGGGVPLEGYAPFGGDGLVVSSVDPARRELVVTAPSTAGSYDLACEAVSAAARTIRVYEDAEVDGLELLPATPTTRPLTVGERRTLYSMPLLGDDVVCLEALERAVVVTTPGTCSLDASLELAEATTSEPRFDVFARGAGTCTVEVTLTATGAGDSYELQVVDAT